MKVIELRTREGEVVARDVGRPLPAGVSSAGSFVAASNRSADGEFQRRVLDKRVDLLKRIVDGIPPVEYLPASVGMLIRGKRHLIAAPRKEGKSLGMLVHWARMALADARVIVLDRENGADEYARRLDGIMSAWGLARPARTRLTRNLVYYEFPQFRRSDGAAIAEMAEGAAAVVFDSQRMFLTDFDLKESESDDYAEFMRYAVEPLFHAGVATVILDNTGHADKTRARGSSAKNDLNEVLFTLKTDEPFSANRAGKLRLVLAPGNSRFGNEGEWEMRVGGGIFTEWRLVGEVKPLDPGFRAAAEHALGAAGLDGLSQTKLLDAIRKSGIEFTNETGREWLAELDADGAVAIYAVPPEKPGLPITFYGGAARAS